MTGLVSAVAAAFLLGLPFLLGVLGFTALGRDRVSAGVLLAVLAVFALSNAIGSSPVAPGGPGGAAGAAGNGPLDPLWVWLGLWIVAAAGLGFRLSRDRRQGHVRSTFESLVVLASGAILVATLVSLPTIAAALARVPAG